MTGARANGELVLVVDDEEDIREIVVELLLAGGFAAESASNGQVALDRLNSGAPKPRLIVLDLLMPLVDGPTFRKAQLADANLAAIPVVVISANARVDETAKEMGVDAWLSKPFDGRALVACVKQALAARA